GSADPTASYGYRVFAFARLNDDGSFDATFSGDGRWTSASSSGADDWMYGMDVQPDGKLIAAGNRGFATNPRNTLVMRVNTDGTLDSSFSGDGMVLIDAGGISGDYPDDFAYDAAVDSLGRIVVFSQAQRILISRLIPAGALDSTFDGDGVALADFGGQNAPTDFLVQPDNKIVVGGFVYISGFKAALLRLTDTGSYDSSFSGDGRLYHRFTPADRIYAMALQPDSKIVTSGSGWAGGPGYDVVVARWLGDFNQVHSTTLAITGDSPDPSAFGQSVNVTWTLTSSGGTPGGTVTVTDGVDSCSAPASSGGCPIQLTTGGTRTLTATFAGDPSFCRSSATTTHTVQKAASTTSIVLPPGTTTIGSPLQVTVNVTSAVGTPTGSVSVSDGAGATCSIALASGTGSCTLHPTVAGTRNVTATYAGSAGHFGSSAAASRTFNPAATKTTLTSHGPDPSTVGESVAFDVRVTSSFGTPTGSVTVSDGLGQSCTAALSGGSGSCSIACSSAGDRTITASYARQGSWDASSATASQSVTVAGTVTTIASHTPDPASVGTPVSVSVTVTGGSMTPAGSVEISDGAGASCTITLASGAGSCSFTPAVPGMRNITATYGRDAAHTGSTSSVSHQFVGGATTTAIVSHAPNPSVVGQAVTVSVTVSASFGTPTGSVTVSDGAGASCTAGLTAGAGSCSFTAFVAGTRDITASYSGDGIYDASTAQASHVFEKAATMTTITADSPDPSAAGAAVTVAVSVQSAFGTPGGDVFVTDGLGASCVATLAGGAGSCDIAFGTPGARTITATYAGDTTHAGSGAAEPHEVRDATAPGFVSVTPSETVLWPANHKMHEVRFDVVLTDDFDAAPTARIIGVTVNEPGDGIGDGNASPDWEITGPLTVELRAERSGKGSGREYHVTIAASDASGNDATHTVVIRAPRHP
ncbi:MAG: Ig-like domain repeat protein, partial [Thermoanaerobaculia bacterium]